MNRGRRLLVPAIVVAVFLVAGLVGWLSGSGRLGDRRAELEERIATYINVLTTVRREREVRPALDARIDGVADRTLGGDLERVDSELRRKLATLGRDAGLDGLTVGTRRGSSVGTPARREFRRTAAERSYRDELDFVLVGATVTGSGTLAQVVDFMHRLDASPWIKRVESVRLDPTRDKGRMAIGVGVTTLFLPGVDPVEGGPPEAAPRRPIERYARLVERDPFVMPARPKPKPQASRPKPPPAPVRPVDPLSRWMLTGLVAGEPGDEAWCRHVDSGRTAPLLPGEPLALPDGGTVLLVAIDGEVATIASGEETWRVLVGSTLDQRLP